MTRPQHKGIRYTYEADRLRDGGDLELMRLSASISTDFTGSIQDDTISGDSRSLGSHAHDPSEQHVHHHEHSDASCTHSEDLTRRERKIAYLGATAIGLGLTAFEALTQWLEHKSGQPLGKILSSTMFNDMRHNGIIDASAYLSLAWASTSSKVGRFFSRFAGGAIVAGSGLSLYTTAEMAMYDRDELLHGHQSVASRLGTGVIMAAGNISQMQWVKTKTGRSNHPDHRRARRHAKYDGYGSVAKVAFNDVPVVGEAVATYLNIRDTETGIEGAMGNGVACDHDHADEVPTHISWKSRIRTIRSRLKAVRSREGNNPERRQIRRRRLITAGVGAVALLSAAHMGHGSNKVPEASEIVTPVADEVASDAWGGPDALDAPIDIPAPEMPPVVSLPKWDAETGEGSVWGLAAQNARNILGREPTDEEVYLLADAMLKINGWGWGDGRDLPEGQLVHMISVEQARLKLAAA